MNISKQKASFSIILMLLTSLTLAGCKEITMADLETRYGITYVKGSRTPFSGMVKSYYDSDSGDEEDRKVFIEGFYTLGYKSDKWITHKWDGGRVETPYNSGRKEGIEKTFNSNGSPVREQRFFDGRPHGNDIHFDKNKKTTLQLFYRHGVLGPPQPNRKAEIKMEEEEVLAAQKRDERLFGKRKKSWIEHVIDLL